MLNPTMSPIEKVWHYVLRITSGLTLLFLILPVIVEFTLVAAVLFGKFDWRFAAITFVSGGSGSGTFTRWSTKRTVIDSGSGEGAGCGAWRNAMPMTRAATITSTTNTRCSSSDHGDFSAAVIEQRTHHSGADEACTSGDDDAHQRGVHSK